MKGKSLLLIICFTLFNTNCVSQQKKSIDENKSTSLQKTMKIEKIEIKEQTRGTNRLMTFIPGSKIVSVNGNSNTSSLSSMEWENISKQVNAIDLSKISSLESPTTNRYSDRALSSSISIYANGKTYISSTFDAGIPPQELTDLYRTLMGTAKTKNPRKGIR